MSIRKRFIRAPLSRIYLFLSRYVRNHYGIEIPDNTQIGRRVQLGHQHGIVIHPNTIIGDDCVIRHNVTMGVASLNRIWEAPTLGKSVEVGVGAALIGDITIGDGATIGANAVVRSDVPPGAVAVGNPARIIPPSKHTNRTNGQLALKK